MNQARINDYGTLSRDPCAIMPGSFHFGGRKWRDSFLQLESWPYQARPPGENAKDTWEGWGYLNIWWYWSEYVYKKIG